MAAGDLGAVRVPPEHHGPDLAAADAALRVQRAGQRLPRVLQRRDVGQQRPGVQVDRVPADRPDAPARRPRTGPRPGTRSTGSGSAGSPRRPPRAGPGRSPRGPVRPGRRRSGSPRSGSGRFGTARPARRRPWPASRRCWPARPSSPTSSCRRRARPSRATMSGTRGRAWPGSRCLMNQAFSANRQASRNSGIPFRSQTLRTSLRLASDTGWPPPELLVTVIMTTGMVAARAPRAAAPAPRRPCCP